MENRITSYSLRQGLIFGLINILLTLIIYFLGADFFASHFIMLPVLLLIIAIVYPIVLTIRYRKLNGGFLSFKDAYKISFFVMLISGLIVALFGILLYHVIDPEYPKMIQDKMIEKISEYMANAGLSEEKIQSSLNPNEFADKFSLFGQIKSFLFSIIFYAIFSLIVAAIAKKNEQPFDSKVLDK